MYLEKAFNGLPAPHRKDADDDDYEDTIDFGNLLYKISLFIMIKIAYCSNKISCDEMVFSGRIWSNILCFSQVVFKLGLYLCHCS